MASRHTFVDALRGFALLGIIVVNIEFVIQSSDIGFSRYTGAVDVVTRWLTVALGQTKIYPIFALLFGYGLSIQIERARHSSQDLKPRYRRRMFGLILLGILHGVFFFPGDILVIYAVVGTLAYRFGDREPWQLVRRAAWTYGIAAVGWLLIGLLDTMATASPPTTDPEVIDALANGSFFDVAVVQSIYWVFTLLILSAVQGPAVFTCFLLGIALGKTDILAKPNRHRPLFHRTLRWTPLGLIGAAIGASLTVAGGRWETLGFAIGFAAAPLVAAGYVALLALTIGRGESRLSRVLQASGRMSLTVYLLESVVLAVLSYGYGFGLFANVGPLAAMGIAVAVWIALSAFAVLWMRHYHFGPLEWALRSFTYGKRQRLRLAKEVQDRVVS